MLADLASINHPSGNNTSNIKHNTVHLTWNRRFTVKHEISTRTNATYFCAVFLYLYWYIGEATVHHGMPSSKIYNTDLDALTSYFTSPEPQRRLRFAIYLLGFWDADGCLHQKSYYSNNNIPGYKLVALQLYQRDSVILDFIRDTLEEYGYTSTSRLREHGVTVLTIPFLNNNNIATNFISPALEALDDELYPFSGKMAMLRYCIGNNLFSKKHMWPPWEIPFSEYVIDMNDDILVVLGE